MRSNLAIAPVEFGHRLSVSFAASNNNQYKKNNLKPALPPPKVKTPKSERPVALDDVAFWVAHKFANKADDAGLSRTDWLLLNIPSLSYVPQVLPEPSKTAMVGKTNVTTLIDGEQIFA